VTADSDQLRPDAMGEERRARVLGLGCSNSDGVSSYGTRTTRGNILLTFSGGDGRGWSGNGGAVETKLCIGERLLRRFFIQGEGWASTGVTWRCFSTGQRSSKWIGGGSRSWGRLAASARFGRSIRAGGAPIYRGEPIYSLGRARPLAGFRPTVSLVFKIPFLFPNLFIICKII
jgi:hypothetical protein